ncbi:DUF2491 family protein, partial [bacterium]|nr:DUF2491 family protein [bacterium]
MGKALSWVRAGVLALALAVMPLLATAGSSSSGSRSSSSGYSRSSGSSSRTPSTSSGGYARPSKPSAAAPAPTSAADKAISRQNSAQALDGYRKSQQTATRTSVPPSGGASSSSWSWPSYNGGSSRRPSADVYAPYRRYDQQWTPQPYAMQGPRRFGLWDAAMLWFMLDTLTKPGHAGFFHDNAQDPGYQQWRGEADKLAKDNAELKAKLAGLDSSLAAQADAPRQPGRVPPDVADKLIPAKADMTADDEDGGVIAAVVGFLTLLALAAFFIFAVVIVFKFWRRIFGGSKPPPASAAGGRTVFDLFKGKSDARAPFRVGMTVSIDPTPFLLAGDAVKAKQPAASSGGLTNIQGVGTLTGGALTLHRLYLTDNDYLQIHLDKGGRPDECRFFHVVDEVAPADQGEWAQWLDKKDGMIGWPEFP